MLQRHPFLLAFETTQTSTVLLQRVAACCIASQCVVAVRCSLLQCVAATSPVLLQHVAACCIAPQCVVAVCCSVLQ